jgi:CheY-like chemotaxis protein
LGLAISKKLIESHSGTIEAKSLGTGCGSTFLIVLPLTSAPVEYDTSRLRKTTAGIPKTPVIKVPRRILLVEDHEPTRTTMIGLLARRQYEVIGVGTVADAHNEVQKQSFDLLISDIGLPDGNGFDLMTALHEQFRLKGIALTGYGMEQDIAHSQQAGFVTHLTKPIRIEMLDEALGRVFSS